MIQESASLAGPCVNGTIIRCVTAATQRRFWQIESTEIEKKPGLLQRV